MEDLFSPSCWKAAALAAALLGCCGTARAEVLLFSANPRQQAFSEAGLFDFNGTAPGGTTHTFTTSANQRVILVFDATCFIVGTGGAVVNILVNPAGSAPEAAAPPTNGVANGGVLVRSQQTDDFGNDGARVTVVAGVRPAVAGSHTVKVRVVPRGDLSGGPPPQVHMQAASLTVMR